MNTPLVHLCAKESKLLDTKSRWFVLQQVGLRYALLSYLASLSCSMPLMKMFLVFYWILDRPSNLSTMHHQIGGNSLHSQSLCPYGLPQS